jgi:DNA helicase-2/ATP-dependent DNA helicase PcrA
MTVHAAKGLEFNHVYIVGMEEDLFPSPYSETIDDLEEERRLFYVAITRARKLAVITYALTRFRWGSLITCNPSRFIQEIDPEYLDLPDDPRDLTEDDEDDFFEKARSKYFSGSKQNHVPPAVRDSYPPPLPRRK